MDILTMLIMIATGNFISALLVYTYSKRYFSRTLRYHFYSQILLAVAFSLYILLDLVLFRSLIVLANICILFGVVCEVFSIMELTGTCTLKMKKLIMIFAVIIGIVQASLALMIDYANIRIAIISAALCLLWLIPSYLLLKEKNKSILQQLVGVIFLLIVASMSIRIYEALEFSRQYILYMPATGQISTFMSYFAFMIVSGSGISLLAKEKTDEQLQIIATRDELTGLYNRRHFIQETVKAINFSQRNKYAFSLLMLDIDHFKKVNDTFGHQKGDLVLKEFANILQCDLRQYDLLGRVGGEEFQIFLQSINKEDAYMVAERIRQLVENNNATGVHFTTSIGIYSAEPGDSELKNFDEMYRQSDLALYEAKNTGRNRVVQRTNIDAIVSV